MIIPDVVSLFSAL